MPSVALDVSSPACPTKKGCNIKFNVHVYVSSCWAAPPRNEECTPARSNPAFRNPALQQLTANLRNPPRTGSERSSTPNNLSSQTRPRSADIYLYAFKTTTKTLHSKSKTLLVDSNHPVRSGRKSTAPAIDRLTRATKIASFLLLSILS